MPPTKYKKDKAKKGCAKFKTYEDCLMKKKNYEDVVDALAVEDYDAVIKIFNDCKVPIEHQNNLLTFAKDCYEMRYCQW